MTDSTISKNGGSTNARVLHVNDCAFYAQRVLEEASVRGLPWGFYPRAVADSTRSGLFGRVRFGVQGVSWLAGLARRALQVDLLHIHSASMIHHTQFVPKRYVLTLHGTDIRTLQYDDRWRGSILKGVRNASAVMYTTPDLREHVVPHRPDAIYLPVPITTGNLPARTTDGFMRARIFFVSRWDESKGAQDQLEAARELVRLSKGDYDVYGLDWGPFAAEASDAGVVLVPKMPHGAFLEFLSRCTVAVGQSSGVLGSSELEALGIGVPLYMPLRPGLYPDDLPVGWGQSGGPASMAGFIADEVLNDQAMNERAAEGVRWVEFHHGTAETVDKLRRIYRDALP